jgi:hypothetical protein
MFRLSFLILLFSFSLPAFAVYKCENGGKVTYSDTTCMTGKSLDLGNQANSSSAADIARTQAQNAHEKKELRELETARHKREATEEKEQKKLAKTAEAKRKKCASLALKKKWSDEDLTRAAGKSQEKALVRAHRAAEKYELECGK